jgi:hypothetical protein
MAQAHILRITQLPQGIFRKGDFMRISNRMYPMLLCAALILPVMAQQGAPQGGGPAQSGGGQSQNHTLKVDHFIQQVDTDKDGRISKAEWQAAGLLDNVFTTMDTNKDGYLSKEELEVNKFPDGIDAYHNGILTLENMKAFDKKMGFGKPGAGGAGGAGAPPSGSAPKN